MISADHVTEAEATLDMEGIEGAQTLSTLESLDSRKRVYNYPDHQSQSLPTPASSSVTFSQDPRISQPGTMHGSPLEVSSTSLVDNALLGMDESSLAEFLRDVMMPVSPNSLAAQHSTDFLPQQYSNSGRDVFNFGMDYSLDMNDVDFGWIHSQNSLRQQPVWNPPQEIEQPVVRGHPTPDITAGAEAFQKSVWRWKPNQKEHTNAEQINLSIPKDMQYLEARLPPDVFNQRIEQSSRDQILAMLLGTCEPENITRVVTSFPSADLLDSLMHLFFRSELQSTDAFVHLPSFRPQYQLPELNAIVVAAGAILSNVPTIRRLGFAIQESVRTALVKIVSSSIFLPPFCNSTELALPGKS